MEKKREHYESQYCKYSYNVVSNPREIDSDDDGLDDFEEVKGTNTIYVANTRTNALGFMNAVSNGQDASLYLTTVTSRDIASKPFKNDTDDDGIYDGDEIIRGTNPNSDDSDGDRIPDLLEPFIGEDPTIFDVTPPVIKHHEIVSKDGITFKYDFMYGAYDPGGVKDIALFKNGIQKDSHTYPSGINFVNENKYFETDWESFLDGMRGAQVTVDAGDWNGNSESGVVIYHRSSVYGLWAAGLGSDTIMGDQIAADLGSLSGGAAVVAQTPEFAVQFSSDPSGYLKDMKTLADSLYSDPSLLVQLIEALPQSIKDQQELENPYAPGTEYHSRFANGWYAGYIVMTVATLYLGGEVVKSIKTSEEFAQLTNGLIGKMDDIKLYWKASKAFGKVDRVGYLLLTHSGPLETKAFSSFIDKMMYDAIKAQVKTGIKQLQEGGISNDVINKYLDDVSTLKGIDGTKKFRDAIIKGNDISAFKTTVWEAKRAAYYKNIAKSIELDPIKGANKEGRADIKVVIEENGIEVTKYIENKKAIEELTDGTLKRFIDSAQEKFGSKEANAVIKPRDKTRIEIDASEGLGISKNKIGDTINGYMRDAYNVGETPDHNLVNEIEIFFDDGSTQKGIKNADTGVFDWM